MERGVAVAVLAERTRRLELEIELQNLSSQSTSFSPQEEREFLYIYHKLDAPREISFSSGKEGLTFHQAKISFLKFLLSFTGSPYQTNFDTSTFANHVVAILRDAYPEEEVLNVKLQDSFSVELKTYGLTELRESSNPYVSLEYLFTPRLDRFRFWVEVNERHSETPLFQTCDDSARSANTN